MPVALTHVGEAVTATMIDSLRWEFIEQCGLVARSNKAFVCDTTHQFVYFNAKLAPYAGLGFDGASCVDLVVLVQEHLGVPFELKLGENRLTKSRIDEEWLTGCEPSHKGKRWKGNMMSILERKFPPATSPDVLKARIDGREVALTDEWFIVARSGIIEGWKDTERPSFSSRVQMVRFDSIVEKFGGKEPFNRMVQKLLHFDFYSAWVPSCHV